MVEWPYTAWLAQYDPSLHLISTNVPSLQYPQRHSASLWTHFSQPINIQPCFMCFCIMTPHLTYSVDLPWNSHSTTLKLVGEWSLSKKFYFLHKVYQSPPLFKKLGSTSALWRKATLNSKIINKQKKCKKCSTRMTAKGQLFIVWELKHHLSGPQVGWCVPGDSNFLPLWACLQMTMKTPRILILELQINFSKCKYGICKQWGLTLIVLTNLSPVKRYLTSWLIKQLSWSWFSFPLVTSSSSDSVHFMLCKIRNMLTGTQFPTWSWISYPNANKISSFMQ